MRGKKYKKLISWVLCACMIIGVIPVSSLAANTNQQAKISVATQTKTKEEKETATEKAVQTEKQGDSKEEAATEKESESQGNKKEDKDSGGEDSTESDSEKENTESTEGKEDSEKETEEEKTEEERDENTADKKEDTEESTTESPAEEQTTQEEKEDEEEAENDIALLDVSGNAGVTAVKLTTDKDNNNSVWGKGIITGSEDLDEKCWDGQTDTNRGYDNSSSNAIIRSFDSIKYNVSSTFNMDGEAHTLVYEVTLPDDDEITLDKSGMKNVSEAISEQKNADGTKTYLCKYNLPSDYAGGEKEENIIVKIGNKHQGDTVKPTIRAYFDDNRAAALKVQNMETVTVTTAPMYNIVLKKKNNETILRDIYDFSNGTKVGENASATVDSVINSYKDKNVYGYNCTYGVALELRKPGNGIKGVEIPDATKDFTFDIDLSDATLNGKYLVTEGFLPLLYYVGPNAPGGGAITELPFTKTQTGILEGMGCYNSGNVAMTQDGTTLHVTVKNFGINMEKFPKKNYSGTSYWEDINKIREGMFSAFQFQVVYPYVNEEDENLQGKLGDGTVNVKAEVKNMNATSETGTTTKNESHTNDNEQTNTWDLESGNKKNQQIFYSSRKNIIDPYTPGKVWNDGDMAAVGADDLAFTVTYTENNLTAKDPVANMPVAIDQFVLFDRNAIEDVEFSKAEQAATSNKDGYTCSVRYAVRKAGRMDNDSMRTASLDDFDFYDTKPEGGCDAVLVQYRGANLNGSNLTLRAQFNAKVKADATIADKVYMITAFTNTWTASDFAQEILKDTGKEALNNTTVTREDLSTWGKKYNSAETAAALVNGKTLTQPTIDNRNSYTVPGYKDGVYSVDKDHKTNISFADGLYIVPYTTTVTKTVAQLKDTGVKDDTKTDAQDSTGEATKGEPREIYDVGKGEYYVDYKISSSFKYWADINPVEGATTTVYLEDTIPEELTYIPGSAYWGGTYTSQFPKAGKVTGGKQIEPEVTTDNGQTVLKWTIPGVSLEKGEKPTLYYSCQISKDVADNANLKNTVTIQTDEDKREPFAQHENISTAGISVTRAKEFYIVKRGGDHLELQDNSYYELIASNTSSEDRKDLCLFDTMPYKGDGKKTLTKNPTDTQMDGKYQITALTMDANDVNHASDMEIWYTNDAKYIGKTAENIDPADVTEANGWKKADASGYEGDTITFTGDGLIGAWPTVIAYKDANLEKNTIATLRLEYEAVAGAENDDFVNTWSTMSNKKELKSEAETDIYKRTLEGTVWYDKDKDGKIGEDEAKLEGVKVTLLVKDKNGNYVPYTPYDETVDGKTYKFPSTVETDKDGHYKFSGLPSGDYRVKFESSDGTDLGHYDVTEPNADKDKTLTSKVEKDNAKKDENGELTSGTITDIGMPTLGELVETNEKNHNLPDQNLGLIIPTVDISGTKTWDDANNQDGKRPESITIRLLADGKEEKSKTVTEADNWKWEFKDLPKYSESNLKDLQEITYTVTEDAVKDYTTTVDGYNVTNSYTPEITSVAGSKTWDDADNQDGKRPESITIRLLANGTEVASKEVKEADGWKWEFTKLAKYANGEKITYTVIEDAVKDYTTTVDGFNVTNSYKPGKVSIPVTKSWNDANNQDGKRPDSVKIHLYADGRDTGKKLELTAGNNWSGTFTDLDERKAGKEIKYTVKEDAVDGYTEEITGDAQKGYVVTNSYTPETISVTGSKSWDDADDQDGKRPNAITIRLLANGTAVASTEATEATGWTWEFKDYPKYKAGEEITYTVEEDAVAGYEGSIKNTKEGYVITNKHTPETISIEGSKTWDDKDNQDGKRPESITIRLLADGKETANKTVTEADNWSWSFTDLPKYANGKEIIYTVTEDSVENYTIKVDGYNVTNSYTPGKVSVPVTKAWDDADNRDGKRPESVTFRLYANGDKTENTLTVTEKENWSGTFTDLDEYKAGKKIEYTVQEETKIEGYEDVVTGDAKEGYVVTNKHTPETTSVEGSKTWDDKDNQDGKRPESIMIRLLANGTEVATKEITEKDDWSWSFTDLPKYESGTEIIYTVTEDAVENYTTTVEDYNVTNSYTPGKVSVLITKAWNDANNQDGKRPESVTFYLYADGQDTGKTLTVTEKENWSGTFTDLDEYKAGKKITYTVQEDAVDGYTTSISGDMAQGYIVTNTHTPKNRDEIPDDNLNTPDENDDDDDDESEESSDSSDSSSNESSDSNSTGQNGTSQRKTGKSTKTGDSSQVVQWIVISVIALGAIVMLLTYKRKRAK